MNKKKHRIPAGERKSVVLMTRLETDLAQWLRELAASNGVTVSRQMHLLLTEWIERHKEEQQS